MKSEAGFVLAVSGLLSRWLSLAVLRFRSGAPHSDLAVIPLTGGLHFSRDWLTS